MRLYDVISEVAFNKRNDEPSPMISKVVLASHLFTYTVLSGASRTSIFHLSHIYSSIVKG